MLQKMFNLGFITQTGQINMLIPVNYFIIECALSAAVYFWGNGRTLEL